MRHNLYGALLLSALVSPFAFFTGPAAHAAALITAAQYEYLGEFHLNANKEQVRRAVKKAMAALEYPINEGASEEFEVTTKRFTIKDGAVELGVQLVVSIKDSPKTQGTTLMVMPRFYKKGDLLALNHAAMGPILKMNAQFYDEVVRQLRKDR